MTTTNSNVTPIESKQPAPSCRFAITVSLSGFPVTIEGEGRAGDLKLIIDRLKSIGSVRRDSGRRSHRLCFATLTP